MKFKVGDKVRVKKNLLLGEYYDEYRFVTDMLQYRGKIFEIVEVSDNYYRLKGCVHFKYGPRYFTDAMVEPVNETIVIYRKGAEVIALDKVTGKKAVAKCNPADKFDFNIGAKLAFERLTAPETPPAPKLLNTKVVVTKVFDKVASEILTVGKIYELKDGVFFGDGGITVSVDSTPFKNLEDLKHRAGFIFDFVELVE